MGFDVEMDAGPLWLQDQINECLINSGASMGKEPECHGLGPQAAWTQTQDRLLTAQGNKDMTAMIWAIQTTA
jgi:hypothetical protein